MVEEGQAVEAVKTVSINTAYKQFVEQCYLLIPERFFSACIGTVKYNR